MQPPHRPTGVVTDHPADRRPSTRSPAHATDRHVMPNDYPVCNATTRPAVRPTLGHANDRTTRGPTGGAGACPQRVPGGTVCVELDDVQHAVYDNDTVVECGPRGTGATPSPILPNQKP